MIYLYGEHSYWKVTEPGGEVDEHVAAKHCSVNRKCHWVTDAVKETPEVQDWPVRLLNYHSDTTFH